MRTSREQRERNSRDEQHRERGRHARSRQDHQELSAAKLVRAIAGGPLEWPQLITLHETPRLVWPTTEVRTSYLTGEQADCLLRGTPTEWLGPASEDFDSFVAERRGVSTRWNVPSTVFWYVSGEHYLGSLVVRHELTAELADVGGHVGYHVVAPWRRQGHATRMLAAGLDECRRLDLREVLLTCQADNEASRRVIIANGGKPDGQNAGEVRFWISLE